MYAGDRKILYYYDIRILVLSILKKGITLQ